MGQPVHADGHPASLLPVLRPQVPSLGKACCLPPEVVPVVAEGRLRALESPCYFGWRPSDSFPMAAADAGPTLPPAGTDPLPQAAPPGLQTTACSPWIWSAPEGLRVSRGGLLGRGWIRRALTSTVGQSRVDCAVVVLWEVVETEGLCELEEGAAGGVLEGTPGPAPSSLSVCLRWGLPELSRSLGHDPDGPPQSWSTDSLPPPH